MDDRRRILVAGVGNVFYADDGFGVEVVQRMHRHDWPPQVRIADFGIRGIDLAYALLDGEYSLAILADLLPGDEPGRVRVLQPELDGGRAARRRSPAWPRLTCSILAACCRRCGGWGNCRSYAW